MEVGVIAFMRCHKMINGSKLLFFLADPGISESKIFSGKPNMGPHGALGPGALGPGLLGPQGPWDRASWDPGDRGTGPHGTPGTLGPGLLGPQGPRGPSSLFFYY